MRLTKREKKIDVRKERVRAMVGKKNSVTHMKTSCKQSIERGRVIKKTGQKVMRERAREKERENMQEKERKIRKSHIQWCDLLAHRPGMTQI